jgi:hypothetical protein
LEIGWERKNEPAYNFIMTAPDIDKRTGPLAKRPVHHYYSLFRLRRNIDIFVITCSISKHAKSIILERDDGAYSIRLLERDIN